MTLQEEYDAAKAKSDALARELVAERARGRCTYSIIFNGDSVFYGQASHFVAATVWRTNELPGQLLYVGEDPDVVKAAAEALEAAGFGVAVGASHQPDHPTLRHRSPAVTVLCPE